MADETQPPPLKLKPKLRLEVDTKTNIGAEGKETIALPTPPPTAVPPSLGVPPSAVEPTDGGGRLRLKPKLSLATEAATPMGGSFPSPVAPPETVVPPGPVVMPKIEPLTPPLAEAKSAAPTETRVRLKRKIQTDAPPSPATAAPAEPVKKESTDTAAPALMPQSLADFLAMEAANKATAETPKAETPKPKTDAAPQLPTEKVVLFKTDNPPEILGTVNTVLVKGPTGATLAPIPTPPAPAVPPLQSPASNPAGARSTGIESPGGSSYVKTGKTQAPFLTDSKVPHFKGPAGEVPLPTAAIKELNSHNPKSLKIGVAIVIAVMGLIFVVLAFLAWRLLTAEETKPSPTPELNAKTNSAPPPSPQVLTKAVAPIKADKPGPSPEPKPGPAPVEPSQSTTPPLARARTVVETRAKLEENRLGATQETTATKALPPPPPAARAARLDEESAPPIPLTQVTMADKEPVLPAGPSKAASLPTLPNVNQVAAAPQASAAFKRFVADATIPGVFQGNPPRAIVNGRTVRAGDLVDKQLGIVFDRVEPATKTITFRDGTGAKVSRRY